MSVSSAPQVLIIAAPGEATWLDERLRRVFPLITINRLSPAETLPADDQTVYDVVLALDETRLELVQTRWSAVFMGVVLLRDDGAIDLTPVGSQPGFWADVLKHHLNQPSGIAVQRMAERMALVNEVSLEISAIHDLDKILNIIPDRLTDRFDYYHASVGVIDGDSIEMYEASQRSRAVGPERFRIPLDLEGIVPWVGRQGTTYLASDTRVDDVWIPGKGLEASRSELAVPLIYRGRTIGIIDVQSAHVDAFDQDDVSVLQALAGQLAVAIENARLFDENLRQRQIAETLSRISRLAGTFLDVVEVSQTVIDELKQLIPFDAALIALFEDGHFDVVYETGYGGVDKPSVRWLVDESLLLYRVVHLQRPLMIPNTTQDRLWEKVVRRQLTRAWIGVPLLNRGQPIGVLSIANFSPGAYDEATSDLLFAFANQIAGTVDNAQLFQRLEQREREARAQYEITRLLVSLDRESIPASVLNLLDHTVPFDLGGILVVGEPYQLVITAQRALEMTVVKELEERLISAVQALSEDLVNRQMLARQVNWIGTEPTGERSLRVEARLSAPLLIGRHVVGVMELAKVGSTLYSEADLRTLHMIANSMATALENARLYQALMARADKLQQAVDELAAADRLKDELVSNVSHELRSPLTYVVGYVDLLLAGDLGELADEQRESLEIVASKARMLTRLVSDILAYETHATDELMLSEVHLVTLAQRMAQDAQLNAEKAGIHVVTDLPADAPPVMIDSERIAQVFNNLLGNAIKFSNEGDTITVRLRQVDQHLRVEVEDTGAGIPADKVGRVFERFYQVDMKAHRRLGGAGLGLAICKRIIEGHGGQIGVISEEGVGSTFYFELPYLPPDDADETGE